MAGRPKIDEKYVFEQVRYLRIIFLIHACELLKRRPTYDHLKIALVKKWKSIMYSEKELLNFFIIDSKTKKIFDNRLKPYHVIIKSDGSEQEIYKRTNDIIVQSIRYIKTVREAYYNREFKDGKTKDDFSKLLYRLRGLTSEKLLEKPFEIDNNLWKYIANLRKLDLIEPHGKKRQYTYGLTKKCQKYFTQMHYDNLKYILTEKINLSPGGLIEMKFNKIVELLDTLEYISSEKVPVDKERVISIS